MITRREYFDLRDRAEALETVVANCRGKPNAASDAAEKEMVALLAEANNWVLSDKPFHWTTLRDRKWRSGIDWSASNDPVLFGDHMKFFRHPGGRAAAIVSVPYQPPAKIPDAKRWGTKRGLRVTPFGWPNWYYPQATLLMVWTPLAEKIRPEMDYGVLCGLVEEVESKE